MPQEQAVSPPTPEDLKRLSAQRSVVEEFLSGDEGWRKYTTPPGKLSALCAILRAKIFRADQTFELQCLGVVLGDVFVQDMGFHWVMVEDEYGRDPAIKYRDTSIILFPLTMISKRVERGENVDVFELYNGIAAQVKHLLPRAD